MKKICSNLNLNQKKIKCLTNKTETTSRHKRVISTKRNTIGGGGLFQSM